MVMPYTEIKTLFIFDSVNQGLHRREDASF